jgi:hypothetical protein
MELGSMSLADWQNAKCNTDRTEPRRRAQFAARVAIADSGAGAAPRRLQARYGLRAPGFQDLPVRVSSASRLSRAREEARKNRETKEEPTISLIIKDRFREPTMFIKTKDLI